MDGPSDDLDVRGLPGPAPHGTPESSAVDGPPNGPARHLDIGALRTGIERIAECVPSSGEQQTVASFRLPDHRRILQFDVGNSDRRGCTRVIPVRDASAGHIVDPCLPGDGDIRAFGYSFGIPAPALDHEHARCSCQNDLRASDAVRITRSSDDGLIDLVLQREIELLPVTNGPAYNQYAGGTDLSIVYVPAINGPVDLQTFPFVILPGSGEYEIATAYVPRIGCSGYDFVYPAEYRQLHGTGAVVSSTPPPYYLHKCVRNVLDTRPDDERTAPVESKVIPVFVEAIAATDPIEEHIVDDEVPAGCYILGGDRK